MSYLEMTTEEPEDNKKIEIIKRNISSVLQKQLDAFDKTEERISKSCEAIKKKKKEMQETTLKLKNGLIEEKSKWECLEKMVKDNKDEAMRFKSEYNLVEKNSNMLIKEYENIDAKCLEAKNKPYLSPEDTLTLEIDRKKHNFYCEATNIVWDYSVPLNSYISGCVRNKKKHYLHTFQYENSETTSAEVQENLWKDVENGLHVHWNDMLELQTASNKENQALN